MNTPVSGGAPSSAPLIVSALLGVQQQQWLNALREAHFPAERNHLPAHLTLFHAIPAEHEELLRQRLRQETSRAAPLARLSEVMSLGGGTAFRVESTELELLRSRLAETFREWLTSQDASGWRPHITVQNKVSALEARALLSELAADFRPAALSIRGLALWRYRKGPWEAVAEFWFHR